MTELRLQYAALSDVGRVRKDNQDSGYAGPWLLAVCDGVGGAVRGDIASSTAISALRKLDERPSEELLALVAGAIHRAGDRIGELVEEEPALSGTSTTATMALFDGEEMAFGHVGDSRAYLYRDHELTQLTSDHTFVQTLVDEGRITEEEARTHPNRNLILKALDGVHESEPDLFVLELQDGDRLLLCSDGASGALETDELARILGEGTPDWAAVELVSASLEAGSTDNVTCIVADVLPASIPAPDDLQPLLVGAAAELPRRAPLSRRAHGFFRAHRSEFTSDHAAPESAIPAEAGWAIESDPIDPEHARYAPRPQPKFVWLRRICGLTIALGVAAMLLGLTHWWIQQQYYVGQQDGVVTIFRGINADILGRDLSAPYESTNLTVSQLPQVNATQVTEGLDSGSLDEARRTVERLYTKQDVLGSDSGSDTGS